MFPKPEAETGVVRSSSKVNNESHYQQPNYGDDFDSCEDKFGFTINGDGKNVEENNENDDDRYPSSNIDVVCTRPELDDDRGGGYFSAEGDYGSIPVLFNS